jgi:hypothetical protein
MRPDNDPWPGDPASLVHVWSTRHRNRAVRNGLQRASFALVAGAIHGEQVQVENPDRDALMRWMDVALSS